MFILTQEIIIERICAKHGDRFDLSRVVYTGCQKKITIGCPVHGFFERQYNCFIDSDHGCPRCGKVASNSGRLVDFSTFVERSRLAHPNAGYVYFPDKYVNTRTKTSILCPRHGMFVQDPTQHMLGHGCPACGNENTGLGGRLNTDQFVKRAKEVHGDDRYDYSMVDYVHGETPILIGCNILDHPLFFQTPLRHLAGGGCPVCGKILSSRKLHYTTKRFIEEANRVHGEGKYIYTGVVYEHSETPVLIICAACNHSFLQSPHGHLKGQGCPACAKQRNIKSTKSTTDRFIAAAILKHGEGRYIYSEVEYEHSMTPVLIGCSISNHSPFWQTPHNHLAGCGCPVCSESTGEKAVAKFLTDAGISYEREKTFPDLISEKQLYIDFWIESLNTAIEYNGAQHVRPIKWFGGEKTLAGILIRDEAKRNWAKSKGIKLIEVAHTETDIPSFLRQQLNFV